jgi:hypothetical protein
VGLWRTPYYPAARRKAHARRKNSYEVLVVGTYEDFQAPQSLPIRSASAAAPAGRSKGLKTSPSTRSRLLVLRRKCQVETLLYPPVGSSGQPPGLCVVSVASVRREVLLVCACLLYGITVGQMGDFCDSVLGRCVARGVDEEGLTSTNLTRTCYLVVDCF